MSSPTLHSAFSTLHFSDGGVAAGAFHMYADAEMLDVLQKNSVDRLVVRTFQWDKPTLSFGYLLETEKVKQWAAQSNIGNLDMVKRPTGGGAVLHTTNDLSFSLAWRRDAHLFPDNPRACYEKIHVRLLQTLETFFRSSPSFSSSTVPSPLAGEGQGEGHVELELPTTALTPTLSRKGRGGLTLKEGTCVTISSEEEGNQNSGKSFGNFEKGQVPVCFKEPVCNDVMLDGKKVVGGALRITRNAILYQGTIQLPTVSVGDLKEAVRRAFA